MEKFVVVVLLFAVGAVLANSEGTSNEDSILSKLFVEPILNIFDDSDSNESQSKLNSEETLDDNSTLPNLPEEPLFNVDIFGDIDSDETQKEMAKEYFDVIEDVKFLVYTPDNPIYGQEISHLNLTTIIDSNFILNHPTRFYAHGWMSSGDSAKSIRRAYFNQGNHSVNFIGVNWPSRTVNYLTARQRVNYVGPYLAEFIDTLVNVSFIDLDQIYLIGHSLGAHVCGIAGKYITTGKVRKIVGLDPARPLFDVKNSTARLDSSDAAHVEVIHTNGGLLGIYEPIGTANFYPNGGKSQPGCTWDPTGACSHNRALQFFAESIHTDIPFYATKCACFEEIVAGNCTESDQSVPMGGEPGNVDKIEGVFHLVTNKSKPYAVSSNETKTK